MKKFLILIERSFDVVCKIAVFIGGSGLFLMTVFVTGKSLAALFSMTRLLDRACRPDADALFHHAGCRCWRQGNVFCLAGSL